MSGNVAFVGAIFTTSSASAVALVRRLQLTRPISAFVLSVMCCVMALLIVPVELPAALRMAGKLSALAVPKLAAVGIAALLGILTLARFRTGLSRIFVAANADPGMSRFLIEASEPRIIFPRKYKTRRACQEAFFAASACLVCEPPRPLHDAERCASAACYGFLLGGCTPVRTPFLFERHQLCRLLHSLRRAPV